MSALHLTGLTALARDGTPLSLTPLTATAGGDTLAIRYDGNQVDNWATRRVVWSCASGLRDASGRCYRARPGRLDRALLRDDPLSPALQRLRDPLLLGWIQVGAAHVEA